ncbi:hypothetical protein EC968_006788 [Mortierella alpina]|nr:hypothetical protein EC968_006788 [Mortierella alpina]
MAGRKRAFAETEEQGTSACAPQRRRSRPRFTDTAPPTSPSPVTRRIVQATAARRASAQHHTVVEEGGHDLDDSEAEEAENVDDTEDTEADHEEFIAEIENMEMDLPSHKTTHKADIDADIERLSTHAMNFQ